MLLCQSQLWQLRLSDAQAQRQAAGVRNALLGSGLTRLAGATPVIQHHHRLHRVAAKQVVSAAQGALLDAQTGRRRTRALPCCPMQALQAGTCLKVVLQEAHHHAMVNRQHAPSLNAHPRRLHKLEQVLQSHSQWWVWGLVRGRGVACTRRRRCCRAACRSRQIAPWCSPAPAAHRPCLLLPGERPSAIGTTRG